MEPSAQLNGSGDYFRLLITATSNMVYRMSADWKYMYQLDGKNILADADDPTGDWTEKYIPPQERELVWRTISQAINSQTIFELEHRVYQADGSIGWVHSKAVPVFDEENQLTGWLGAGSDITKRKQAEQALNESKERQAFLLQLSDALREIADPGEIQQTATRMLGEQLSASRVFYVIVDEDGDTADIIGDYSNGVPRRIGRYSLSAFSTAALAEWRAGRTASTSDVNADPRYSQAEREAYAAVSTRAGVGIPLVKKGKLVAILGINQSTPRDWTEQDIGLAGEVAERTWAAVERTKAETALHESEEKYRMLFESIDQGFCIIEMIFDEHGKAADYTFLEVNPVFESQTGLKDAAGKRMRDLQPAHEEHWFAIYGNVVKTQHPIRFVQIASHLSAGLWYEVYAFPVGAPEKNQVAILFNDITERKHAEERQAFLLKLSDTLQPLCDATTIQGEVTGLAKKHFELDRCYYCEVIGENIVVRKDASSEGLPSIKGNYPLNSMPIYEQMLRDRKPFIVDDVHTTDRFDESLRQTCISLQIISFINIPVIKEGKPAGIFCFVQSHPRQWRPDEIDSAVEIAERTWAAVERARTENALQKSEAELAAVFAVLPVGVGFVNTEGEIVFCNEQMDRYLPTRKIPSQDPERAWRWVAHQPDGTIIGSANYPTAQALGGKHIMPGIEFLYQEDSGNKVWVRVASQPVIDAAGNSIGAVCMIIDIDGLKRSGETIRESEERLQLAIHGADIFTWDVDPETGHTTYSSNFNEVIGFEISPISEENYINIYPEDEAFVLAATNDALAGKAPLNVEHRVINSRTNEIIWVKVQGRLVNKADGKAAFIGISQNITDQKQAEEVLKTYNTRLEKEIADRLSDLKESRDQIRSLLDTTLVQMSVLKAVRDERGEITDLRIMLVNKELERVTGRGDLVGKLYAAEYPGIRKVGIFDLILKTIRTGEPTQLDYFYDQDGFQQWFSAGFVKLEDGVVATNMDITDQKQAQAKMRELEDAQQLEIFRVTLRIQEEERRRISESLHNGLGQMLYGIKMSLTQLKAAKAAANPIQYEQDREYTSQLLSDAIRDSRRISHELMPQVLDEFGLKAAIEDTCRQMQDGIHFDCRIDLKDVKLDKYMELAVFRTLQELMINVVKHAQASEARVEVDMPDGHVLVRVSDNGRGISEEKAGKDGIGLASIRSKVDLLDGTFEVDSKPGQGTTVSVRLPYIY